MRSGGIDLGLLGLIVFSSSLVERGLVKSEGEPSASAAQQPLAIRSQGARVTVHRAGNCGIAVAEQGQLFYQAAINPLVGTSTSRPAQPAAFHRRLPDGKPCSG